MKKKFLIVLMAFCFSVLCAQEDASVVESGVSYLSSISLQLSPIVNPKSDDGNGGNHFAPITGIGLPIPYAQFVAKYSIPLNFGSNPIFSGSNIAFIAGPTLTPLTLDTQIGVVFTPSPIINFCLGTTFGTGWSLADNHGIGLYVPSRNEYNACIPFVVWKYDVILQTNIQFDFGIFFENDWSHIILTANEQIVYEGNTAAKDEEPWEWMGSKDYVNGFLHTGNVMLGYMFPVSIFKMIGIAFAWQGHISGKDYGVWESSYNGGFINYSLALQTLLEISNKSQLVLSTSLNSRRAFLEPVQSTDSCITKTASGREWCFSGLTIQWVYNF